VEDGSTTWRVLRQYFLALENSIFTQNNQGQGASRTMPDLDKNIMMSGL